MFELKTLKNIERRFIDFKNHYDYSLNEEAVSINDLRQEAIKWIKYLRTKRKDILKSMGVTKTERSLMDIDSSDVWWIQHFFNITNGELRDNAD